MDQVNLIILVLSIGLACLAASWDILYRKIPNWLCLVIALAGVAVSAVPFDGLQLLAHTAHLGVAFAIGMGLFAIGWWGGGDAKLYAAVAVWFSITNFFELLLWISIAGLLLVLGMFGWRKLRKKARSKDVGQVPYGVAIAAGMITVSARSYFQV